MSDKDLQINVTTTADTSGLDKVIAKEKELGDATAAQSSKIVDATQVSRLSTEQLIANQAARQAAADAFISAEGRQAAALATTAVTAEKTAGGFRVLTEAERATAAAFEAATSKAEKYAAALNVVGRSLGGIVGRKLTSNVGIEGVGRAIEPILGKNLAELAPGLAESGIAASALAAGAAAAAAGVVLKLAIDNLTRSYIENAAASEARGRLFVDENTSVTRAITLAKDLATARREATQDLKNEIYALDQKIIADKKAAAKEGIEGFFGVDPDRAARLADHEAELNFLQKRLATVNETAQKQRDLANADREQLATRAKITEDFRKSSFDAEAPLAQAAITTNDLALNLQKAKDELLAFPEAARLGVTPDGVASIKTAADLYAYSNTLRGQARVLAEQEADGLLRAEQTAKRYADAVKDIAKAEADGRNASQQKIGEDLQRVGDLKRKREELNAAAATGKNVEDALLLNAREQAKLSGDIANNTKAIEDSKKRQLDAQRKFADDEKSALLDAPGGRRGELNEVLAEQKRLSTIIPNNDDDIQTRRAVADRVREINANPGPNPFRSPDDNGRPFNAAPPVAAGDTDNIFSKAQLDQAAANIAESAKSAVQKGFDSISRETAKGFDDMAAAITTQVANLRESIAAAVTAVGAANGRIDGVQDSGGGGYEGN